MTSSWPAETRKKARRHSLAVAAGFFMDRLKRLDCLSMRPSRPAAVAAAVLLAVWVAPVASAQPAPPPPPAPSPAPAPKTSIDADGTYQVGTELVPGTYSSAGPIEGSACYWKRVNGEKMVDNALTKKPQVIQIEATDTAFTTNDCQPWQKTDAPPPPKPGPGELLGQLGAFIGSGVLSGGPR